jgi:lipoprotein-releasing system permease protein
MAKPTRPFSGFEWMIALRYLRARRQESLISVISGFSLVGIALGVATLIIVMSVMNGFRAELLGRILGLNGHMLVQSTAASLPDYDRTAARIRAVPGVTAALPTVEGQVMVNTPNGSIGALVRGLRTQDLVKLTTVSSTLSPGALQHFEEGDSVIIGAGLAEALGLSPGQAITLLAPRGTVTPFGTTPRVKPYRIAGTFRVGMSEYDQTYIFMPLIEAQLFFGLGDAVHRIEVMLATPGRVAEWRVPVQRAGGPATRVVDWQETNASLFGALQVERVTMFLILTLIILVAALNIISGLIMLVKDKGGDIAIMRTMGASRGSLMRIFFIAGASVGVVGTLVGFGLALLFVANIESVRLFLQSLAGTQLFNPEVSFLSQIPAEIDWYEVTAVVLMALGLSFLATLYPSWQAARLDPVEALRYE